MMKAILFSAGAMAAFDFGLGKLTAKLKDNTLAYSGDGGEGRLDYYKYVFHKATPATLRGLALLKDLEPPKETKLRFKGASIEDVMANFNNSLVSNCPIRLFNRGVCTDNSTYSDIHVLEDKLVDAVVVVLANNKQKKIVVSYRATITTQNFLDDFNGAQIDLPGAPDGVKVHRGVYINYLSSYTKVNNIVKRLLDEPRFKKYSVFVTGYSLGGGVATLALPALATLAKDRPDPRRVELISYAAPRVGNDAYAAYLASFKVPVTRLTLAYDIVSHLPIRKLGYTHAGVEVHTDQAERKGNYTIRTCSQEFDEDPTCAWAENDNVGPLRHLFPFGAGFPGFPYA